MSIFDGARKGATVDVGAMFDATTGERLGSIVGSGALVSLFRTRDGGAFGVAITLDGESVKEYFRTPEELHDWLAVADQDVAARAQAPSSGKRPRRAP